MLVSFLAIYLATVGRVITVGAAPAPLIGEELSTQASSIEARQNNSIEARGPPIPDGKHQSCSLVTGGGFYIRRNEEYLYRAMQLACDGRRDDPDVSWDQSVLFSVDNQEYLNDRNYLPSWDMTYAPKSAWVYNATRFPHKVHWVFKMAHGFNWPTDPRDYNSDLRGRCYEAFQLIINECANQNAGPHDGYRDATAEGKPGGVWSPFLAFYLFSPNIA